MEGAGAQLLRIGDNTAYVVAGGEVEADQLAEEMGIGVVVEQRLDSREKGGVRRAEVVGRSELEAVDEQAAQQTERFVLGLSLGSGGEQEEVLELDLDPVRQLVQQAALADPGVADDDERAVPAAGVPRGGGALQLVEFFGAADHPRPTRRSRGGDAECPRLGPLDEIGPLRFVEAFDEQRRLLDDVEQAAHVTVGVVADPQSADRPDCSIRAARLIERPTSSAPSTELSTITVPVSSPTRTWNGWPTSTAPFCRSTTSAAAITARPARTPFSAPCS